MPRWAIIVTAFYVVVVLALFTLTAAYVGNVEVTDALAALIDFESIADTAWGAWLLILGFVAAEAMLLFVAVDRSEHRPTPRRRLVFAVLSMTAAVGVLGTGLVWSLGAAVWGDSPPDSVLQIGTLLPYGLWLFWGIVFYIYREGLSTRFDRAVGWLLNGSVLQFLVAVPCHIVVRQRDDCCAPVATGIGIATGVAIMLMAFGPSVVFLYQKRLRDYGRGSEAQPIVHRWPIGKLFGALMLGSATLFVFLPLDDSWLLGVFVPTENVERLNTGVVDVAARFGLVVQPGDGAGLLLLCNDREVARVLVSVAADGQSQTWQIRLRADQRELMSELESSVAAFAEDTWVSDGPPSIERWRARLIAGAFFGGGCD
jgi:hypothetical protein